MTLLLIVAVLLVCIVAVLLWRWFRRPRVHPSFVSEIAHDVPVATFDSKGFA